MGVSIAERTGFIQRSLDNFGRVLDKMPDSFCLIPGYKAQAAAVLGRLAVPHIEVLEDDTLRASAPKDRNTDDDTLWTVALLPGETMLFDSSMLKTTRSQQTHIAEYLAQYHWAEPVKAAEKARELSDYLVRNQSAFTAQIEKTESGRVGWYGAFVPPSRFNYQGPEDMLVISKPLFTINADIYPKRVHPYVLGHDIIHLVDWLARGIVPSSKTEEGINLRAGLELRATHGGCDLWHELERIGYDASDDGEPSIELAEDVEAQRRRICSPDRPFEVDRRVSEAFQRAGAREAAAIGLAPENRWTLGNMVAGLLHSIGGR